MNPEEKSSDPIIAAPEGEHTLPKKALTPAAQRALAEVAERRKALLEAEANRPVEVNGRGGLDPARYGDWEIKGLTSDF